MKVKIKNKLSDYEKNNFISFNFGNNQNYVLGNSLKKKVLYNFFIKKNISFFLDFVSRVNKLFIKKIMFLSFYYTFLFFQIFLYFGNRGYETGLYFTQNWFMYLILPVMIVSLHSFFSKSDSNYIEVKNFKEFKYKFLFGYEKLGMFFYGAILLSFFQYLSIFAIDSVMISEVSSSGIIYSFFVYLATLGLSIVPILFIAFLYNILKDNLFFKINMINIILIPIFIIYSLIYIIFSFFNVYILRNINNYLFYKINSRGDYFIFIKKDFLKIIGK